MENWSSFIDARYQKKLATPFKVDAPLKLLLERIKSAEGHGILVGGCVRDHLLQEPAKDIDVEVYGLSVDALEQLLSAHFFVTAVGKSFGIFKVLVNASGQSEVFDVALPRTENKSGSGHKGFMVVTDPQMSFVLASSRRDFTINAMGIDVLHNVLFDPHGGEADLKNKRLRHVSEAFSEDPLRVLRAAQFCARFDLSLDDETLALCRQLRDELFTLSRERIFEEMKKLFLAVKPSVGLEVLRQSEAIDLFLDLKALIGVAQDPIWHPEGDVWVHSLMVADQAAGLLKASSLDVDERLIIMAGALCHDLGKPHTTLLKDGRIKSPGHEQAGEEPTRNFLNDMGFPKKLHEPVLALVKEHLKPHQLYSKRDEVSASAIRRLASRVDIKQLLYVSQADFLGRTTEDALAGADPSAPWLKERVEEFVGPDLAPKPILLGRHLLDEHERPGPHFSAILRDAFEAQLDGQFSDEASGVTWLKDYLLRLKS